MALKDEFVEVELQLIRVFHKKKKTRVRVTAIQIFVSIKDF